MFLPVGHFSVGLPHLRGRKPCTFSLNFPKALTTLYAVLVYRVTVYYLFCLCLECKLRDAVIFFYLVFFAHRPLRLPPWHGQSVVFVTERERPMKNVNMQTQIHFLNCVKIKFLAKRNSSKLDSRRGNLKNQKP